MSGTNRDVAPNGRDIASEYFGIGGNPVGQRPDYAPSGAYLGDAHMMELADNLIAPFSPDLGVAEVHGLAAYDDESMLTNYGDDDVLYGLSESLFEEGNLLKLAMTAAAGFAGYTFAPRANINPLLGAVGGVLAFSGARLVADVVKANATPEIVKSPMALAGMGGLGYLAWRQSGEALPAGIGALAGLALLGGGVRKAIEGAA